MSRLIKSQARSTQSPARLIKLKTRNGSTSPSPTNIPILPRLQKARAKPRDEILPSYSDAVRSPLIPQPHVTLPAYSPKPYIACCKIIQTPPARELPPYYDIDPVRAAAVAMSSCASKGRPLKKPPKNRSFKLRVTLRT